jgi:hypothetical protein
MSSNPIVRLFTCMTLAMALPFPGGAQPTTKVAPPTRPQEITCSAALGACACLGNSHCDILKKFASAGGCSDLKCTDGTPQICTCQLDKSPATDSPVFTAAKSHHLLRPSFLDKLAPRPKPTRDCKASASCGGGVSVTCSVKGDGACEGINGGGVSCVKFLTDGSQKSTTAECP